MIDLTIDGLQVSVPEGTTILDAAKTVGIKIPTLCYHAKLSKVGSCRLCLVEVKGTNKLAASCLTPVGKDMEIITNSPKVTKIRKTMLELFLAKHPCDCFTCDKAGDCDLQEYAFLYGPLENRFKVEKRDYIIQDPSPYIERDTKKCLFCRRCIRVCNEVKGVGAIGNIERGKHTEIGPFFYEPLDCEFCGQCVEICPVGALTFKSSKYRAREWEFKKVDTICPYCSIGCSITLDVKDNKIIKVATKDERGVNNGNLCVRGRFGFDFVHNKNRLRLPLVKKGDKLVETSWDEALNIIADRFKEVKEKYGADSVFGLGSSWSTNEENFVFQKFMRAGLGTNNIDYINSFGYSPTNRGLATSFDDNITTNSISEISQAKVILVVGSNISETHPIVGVEIQKAVRLNKAEVLLIDFQDVKLNRYTKVWLRQKPGTDIAILNGLINVIISENLIDKEFLKTGQDGINQLQKLVTKYTPEFVEEIAGISKEDLLKAARIFAKAEKAVIVFADEYGIDYGNRNKVIANLAKITGNIGKENTGYILLKEDCNEQGASDMGMLPHLYPGYQSVTNGSVKAEFEKQWGTPLSDKVGLSASQVMQSEKSNKVKALYIMKADPLSAGLDNDIWEKMLKSADFLVVQDIFLTETAKLADVVLPGLSFAEKEGTVTNLERRVQRINKGIDCGKSTKNDWQILTELSSLIGYEMNYCSESAIMDEIAQLTPIYRDLSYKRLGGNGLQWPCVSVDASCKTFLKEDDFSLALNQLFLEGVTSVLGLKDKKYSYILVTRRTWSNDVRAQNTEGLFKVRPEKILEVNPHDAQQLQLQEGNFVKIKSKNGELKVKVKISRRSPVGVVFTPYFLDSKVENLFQEEIVHGQRSQICLVSLEKV